MEGRVHLRPGGEVAVHRRAVRRTGIGVADRGARDGVQVSHGTVEDDGRGQGNCSALAVVDADAGALDDGGIEDRRRTRRAYPDTVGAAADGHVGQGDIAIGEHAGVGQPIHARPVHVELSTLGQGGTDGGAGAHLTGGAPGARRRSGPRRWRGPLPEVWNSPRGKPVHRLHLRCPD